MADAVYSGPSSLASYNKVPTKELDKRLRPSLGYLAHTDPIGEPVHNDEILVASVGEEIRANHLKWITRAGERR